MKLKFNRNLQLGYGFSIIILLVVGITCYTTLTSLLSSNQAVRHSTLVIQKLEKMLSVMKDAETGQRGYLLTGDETFLEPYHGAYQHALTLSNDATALTADNPAQTVNFSHIHAVLVKRLSILDSLIDKKRDGRIVSTSDLLQGKYAMDSLRQAVDNAEQVENNMLGGQTTQLKHYAVFTPRAILAAILLALVIAVASYLGVVREFKEKEKLQRELQVKEEETAAVNEELTAANEEISASNEELMAINEELSEAREQLFTLNRSLEEKVEERTRALAESEEETQALNEELMATNEELAATNEEMLATNEELERSREDAQKSEKLFRSIAINIPKSLILVMDTEQRLITVEGDLMDKLGYHADGYAGKYMADVALPERYAATKPFYDRMLAGEQLREELKSVTGDDFQVDFVPLKNEQGKVYAGLVIALDITDYKTAQERSSKLAAIVESSADAILSKTLEGVITSWNRSAERIFGYPAAEMIGQSIMKLIPEDRHQEEPQIISRIKSGDRVEHFETERLTREGKKMDVSLTVSPIRDAQGNIIGVSKIARDISEKKQDELRKNDFIGMVSHELKTPLTSLSALIQVLHKKSLSSEDTFAVSALGKANVQVNKMSAMINGFLNVSRLESGKIVIDKSVFDLDELIRETLAEAELTVTRHQIIFEPCNNIAVTADRDKIYSVVSNLISNAVKYSPKGKVITVKCKLIDGYAQVSVQDEGMGIKPEDLSKLFERYYRVATAHTRHISGFGIGLYLSAEIIQRHEGKIWAESKSGVGSTFYFTIPLVEG